MNIHSHRAAMLVREYKNDWTMVCLCNLSHTEDFLIFKDSSVVIVPKTLFVGIGQLFIVGAHCAFPLSQPPPETKHTDLSLDYPHTLFFLTIPTSGFSDIDGR